MQDTEEIWKDIPGFESMYQISTFGRVKSLLRINSNNRTQKERILKAALSIDKKSKVSLGYYSVVLCKNGVRDTKFIHRLVAWNFLEHVDGKKCINHIDCNSLNNNVNNLEFCTHSENYLHAKKFGRKPGNKKIPDE